jgi:hypothetical protein
MLNFKSIRKNKNYLMDSASFTPGYGAKGRSVKVY